MIHRILLDATGAKILLDPEKLNAALVEHSYVRRVPDVHQRILKAADCVKRLFSGTPVKRARIDAELGLSKPSTLNWLRKARAAGLIEFDETSRGWKPASSTAVET